MQRSSIGDAKPMMADTITEKKMTRKRRFGLTLAFMAIFLGIFQVGSLSEPTEEEAHALMDEFQKQIEGIDGVGIFFHNATLALIMFLPGAGAIWGGLAAFQTGYAFASAIVVEPMLAGIPGLALFITPFGLMELFAYGIAMSRSYLLIKHAIKLRKVFIKPLVIEVGIVIALLFTGGLIEMAMIDWAASQGLDLGDMLR